MVEGAVPKYNDPKQLCWTKPKPPLESQEPSKVSARIEELRGRLDKTLGSIISSTIGLAAHYDSLSGILEELRRAMTVQAVMEANITSNTFHEQPGSNNTNHEVSEAV